ncbi:MAG: 30S ribosomal protein S20 [Actinomycetota bacterium]
MANIKSQIKRIKTNEKARLRNKSVRSSIKTAVRKFRDAVATGDSAAITTELKTASKALDVAVAKGVIHKNSAANKKSSMSKAANAKNGSAAKAGVR